MIGDPRLPDRFWAKVQEDESGCWRWTGFHSVPGYGAFRFEGMPRLAHRVSYALLVGAIPDGLTLDHLCRVRDCVNPAHLEPVTHQENVRRATVLVTHCRRGHPLSGSNLAHRPDRPGRICLVCRDAKNAYWNAKARADRLAAKR